MAWDPHPFGRSFGQLVQGYLERLGDDVGPLLSQVGRLVFNARSNEFPHLIVNCKLFVFGWKEMIQIEITLEVFAMFLLYNIISHCLLIIILLELLEL